MVTEGAYGMRPRERALILGYLGGVNPTPSAGWGCLSGRPISKSEK